MKLLPSPLVCRDAVELVSDYLDGTLSRHQRRRLEKHLAACDGYETVDAEWIAPLEALRLGETGERTVIFPTRMNLRRLAESRSTAEALAAARERPQIAVEPVIEMRESGRFLVLPEAMGYGAVEEPFLSM